MPLDLPEGMPVPIRREMPEPPPIVALEPSPDGDNHPAKSPEEQQTADAVFAEEGSDMAAFLGVWGAAQVWGDWAGEKKRKRAEDDEDETDERPELKKR